MADKKNLAVNLLKQVYSALHKKRFDDVVKLVDECTLSVDDIVECVQGTVEINEFETIDEFREENICHVGNEDSESFEVVSYMEADGGNDIPLAAHLYIKNGRTILDIQPD